MQSSGDNCGISRIDRDQNATRGYQVRIRRSGLVYSRFFSDGRFGNSSTALRAAREFRDELLRALPARRSRQRAASSKRNSSGVVGVCRVVSIAASGASYCFWQATWTNREGVRRSSKFSVRRYGSRRAFELACEARRRAEERRSR